MTYDNIEVVHPSEGHVVLIKRNKEIERTKNKRTTYLIKALNCFRWNVNNKRDNITDNANNNEIIIIARRRRMTIMIIMKTKVVVIIIVVKLIMILKVIIDVLIAIAAMVKIRQ